MVTGVLVVALAMLYAAVLNPREDEMPPAVEGSELSDDARAAGGVGVGAAPRLPRRDSAHAPSRWRAW